MTQDDLDHIPSIVPTRDGPAPVGSSRPRPGKSSTPQRGAPVQRPAAGAGTGLLARVCIALSLLVAVAACAWAWHLQQGLQESLTRADDYAKRIGDLEARLSDTDQGMSQNAEVQAAKIRELDTEVRKLWDNVWKQASDRLAKLEKESASQARKVDAATASVASAQGEIKSASGDIAKLKSVSGDLERLIASARANQTEVERLADAVNRVGLDVAKLGKRVQGSEESIQSINVFRKQVNASLVELQSAVRAQPGPAAPAAPLQ